MKRIKCKSDGSIERKSKSAKCDAMENKIKDDIKNG
jgi:hypothetical protein